MISFVWMQWQGKTPVDLGLASWDQVDPQWRTAVMLVREAFEAETALVHKFAVDSHG